MSRDLKSVAEEIVARSDCQCECGLALRELVLALCDANEQEADQDDDGSDDEYEAQTRGKTLMFLVATAVTNGHRWKHRDGA